MLKEEMIKILKKKVSQKMIDLRSDTVTLPTNEMRNAMSQAMVGDDVYGEDPTVNKLEQIAAKKVGKEAALFVSSGTMGNLISILTHCQRGEEAVLEMNSHMYYYEVGSMSAIAGVMPRLFSGNKGIPTIEAIQEAVRGDNIHFPRTTLLCLENTHNYAGGTIIPPQIMERIYRFANQRDISIHLDGARIFNASIALGVDPKTLTKYVDSVMFCLSKGLSAPVGSILAGSKEFIKKARKNRKMLGGGMRQAGIIAAAGIVALENMIERLNTDHQNARLLAEGLVGIEGIKVDLETVQTNMVYIDFSEIGLKASQFMNKLHDHHILVSPISESRFRFVTHYGISQNDIYYTLGEIKEIVKNII